MSKAPADATPAPTPTEAPDGWTNNMDQQQIAAGRGRLMGIGVFLFVSLGLSAAFPYNVIISATDWFHYVLPDVNTISGSLANANFVASVVSTMYISMYRQEEKTTNKNHIRLRRFSFLHLHRPKKSKTILLRTRPRRPPSGVNHQFMRLSQKVSKYP